MGSSKRHQQRLAMGIGAVLTVAEAAGLLPIKDRDARRWLRRVGLIRELEGRSVVVWMEVLEALRAGEPFGDPDQPAQVVCFPRVKLDLS